jgi:hypothetical protein
MKLLKEISQEKEGNQMSLISDTDEIIKFLEFAGNKSILNEHTISCRLTACNNLFSILNEGEDNLEYMMKNLELLVNRFRNKHTNVQASTLKVYKSRVKSSLEDYQAWSKDPIAWEKTVLDKSKLTMSREKKQKAPRPPAPRMEPLETTEADLPQPPPEPSRKTGTSQATGHTRKMSFPIRADFNLEVVIPSDGLTLKELLRLGLFLYPYCKDIGSREENPAWSNLVPRVTN